MNTKLIIVHRQCLLIFYSFFFSYFFLKERHYFFSALVPSNRLFFKVSAKLNVWVTIFDLYLIYGP